MLKRLSINKISNEIFFLICSLTTILSRVWPGAMTLAVWDNSLCFCILATILLYIGALRKSKLKQWLR